ncbi:MAG: NAD(P)-dependent oxidoreductase [Burkholderiales bacterium]|nr:NAD(P)-dependent oxidoreductase [Anaerolineae bacterium]
MRVLVTGGTGDIGSVTVERLLQEGWEVRVVDISKGNKVEGAEYAKIDMLNYDDLLKKMKGCDAVIHLAALRGPQLAPGHTLFQTNAVGTFNVFEAAAALGIKRVVQASSINAFGCAYNIVEMRLQYFPIDEAHPTFVNDPYSLSKQVGEDIGMYCWERDGISGTAMRFPWVYPIGYLSTDAYQTRREKGRKVLDDLLSLPESEQKARLATARTEALAHRKTRPMEYAQYQANKNSGPSDPLANLYFSDRFNFWAFVDVRDAAQSLTKALTAEYKGAHKLFINDDHNMFDYDAQTLIRLFYPDVTELKGDLSGSAALVSIEKARALIGFEPEYSVSKAAKS